MKLDSSFKFGVDNLSPAFLKKFPLGKVIMLMSIVALFFFCVSCIGGLFGATVVAFGPSEN